MVSQKITINGEPVIAFAKWMFMSDIRGLYITKLVKTTCFDALKKEQPCFECFGYDFLTGESVYYKPFFTNGFWYIYWDSVDIARAIDAIERQITREFISKL